MGDRCYLSLQGRLRDREEYEQEAGLVPDEAEAGRALSLEAVVRYECEEANYALYTELNELAKKGLVFVGSHGSGSGYGPGSFCAVNGVYAECEETNDGASFVRVDNAGNPLPVEVKELKSYLRLYARARAALYFGDGRDFLEGFF